MNGKKDVKTDPLHMRLARKRRTTFAVLLLENLSVAFWRPAFWALFFAGLWLWRIPSLFGAPGEIAAFFIFIIGAAFLLWRGRRALTLPSHDAVDRRLEKASALRHRPLDMLDDTLASPGGMDTQSLWHAGKKRAADALRALKTPTPEARIAKIDTAALRAIALLLVVTGFVAAGPQSVERLRHGLTPFSIALHKGTLENVTVWITPPEYTGLDVITLEGGKSDKPLKLPQGSVIKARVKGGFGTPVMKMGDVAKEFRKLDDGNWSLETKVERGSRITIRQLILPRARIPYEFMEDQPPSVKLTGEPSVLPRAEIMFPLEITDDYGATELVMEATLAPDVKDAPAAVPIRDVRTIRTPGGQAYKFDPIYDLAWHSWAGLPVNITFTVRDQQGHASTTEALRMELPERVFRHPVAKSIIEERKLLAHDAAANYGAVAYRLETLMANVGAYQGDPVVFLLLRSAASRLVYSFPAEDISGVLLQLWDTALRVEDGNLTIALRDMRDAQENLQKVLNDPNATPEDIAQAIAEFREAMNQYMVEMVRELQKQMAGNEDLQNLDPEMFGQNFDIGGLSEFMEQLQAQAMAGDRDAARQMLSQLEKMMNMLDPTRQAEMPEDLKFMMEAANELQSLIRAQKELLEQTEERASVMPPEQQEYPEFLPFDQKTLDGLGDAPLPPPPQRKMEPRPPREGAYSVSPQESVAAQEGIRMRLGDLMLKADELLGSIPENMQVAEQEMRGSSAELKNNRPDLSIPPQEAAIEALEESQEQMQQQMAQRMKQMMMLSFGQGPMDPLGRPIREGDGDELFPGSNIKIPDEAARKRVQDILKKLRQRSGELSRPDYEREYYRRLMKQF